MVTPAAPYPRLPAALLLALALALLALAGTAATAQGAVYRCSVNGQVLYQQAPCAVAGGTGAAIKLHVAPGAPPAIKAPAIKTAVPAPAQAPALVQMAAPAVAQRSEIETNADVCLDWYRPMLRDPRSAYWRDANYVQGVLNITVFATNGFGGYVTLDAACEFRAGAIDQGWTKTQAKRRGWAA